MAVVLLCLSAAVAEDVRTWTDTTGKFTIMAKFVALKDGKVTLEKDDGKTVEIDLTKLSPADQKIAKDKAAAMDDDPFKPKDPPKTTTPKKGSRTNPADEKLPAPDWSEAKAIEVVPAKTEWKFTVSAPATEPKLRAAPITLAGRTDFVFEKLRSFAVNAASRHAVVGYGQDFPQDKTMTRIVLCDLEKGTTIASATTPVFMVPADLNDDGTQILMRAEGQKKERLELWTVSNGTINKGTAWAPYGDLDGHNRNVNWAAFTDSKHAITISASGKLAIWDLATTKPIYHMQVLGGCIPAFSPDRKYLAFATSTEIGILELATGQLVVKQNTPQNLNNPILAFSPSGKRLACTNMNKLFVWDFTTGELFRDIDVLAPGAPVLPTDDHALVGMGRLIDLQSQIPLWEYQGAEMPQLIGGLTWFVVDDFNNKRAYIVPARLPHTAAKNALEKAMRDPNYFVVKPGTAIRIDVSGITDQGKQAKALAGLTERVKLIGCTVAANAPVELVASTEAGQVQDITYRSFGMPRFGPAGGGTTYKVKEHFSRLQFRSQGQKIWETQWSNIQHFVHLQNETLEQFLQRNDQPNYGLFERVDLPKYLSKTGNRSLGTSRITGAGLE
jgi:hypothetical protein